MPRAQREPMKIPFPKTSAFLAGFLTLSLLTPIGPVSCVSSPAVIVEAKTSEFDQAAFQAVVDALHAECPLPSDMFLGIKELEGVWGRTFMSGRFLVIELEARQPFQQLLDTLVHEWAHAMVWEADDADHGPIWGVAWARAYNVGLEALQQHYIELYALPEPVEASTD